MNDDTEIECLLQGMTLAKPSPGLDRRVMRGRSHRPVVIAAAFAAAAAAAILAAVGVLAMNDHGKAPAPTRSVAEAPQAVNTDLPTGEIQIEQEWSQVSYQGLMTTTGGASYRRFVQDDVKHLMLVDEATGRNVEVTVPTQQVILVKADLY